jgi:hypothetical protein
MSVDAVVRGAHSSKTATSGAASVGVARSGGPASLPPLEDKSNALAVGRNSWASKTAKTGRRHQPTLNRPTLPVLADIN